MKDYLSYGRARRCCEKHPILTVMLVVLIAAAIVFSIVAIIKLAKREGELLDEEWDLEDEDEMYFCPSEEDFVEGE